MSTTNDDLAFIRDQEHSFRGQLRVFGLDLISGGASGIVAKTV